ncbi:hypothetical protein MHBO_005162 [Bonamia ostreae]|uniref:Uncharacterized protein n=1 Tax=Bonamia ostreae TaxID=126728 RepID=A0ABV2AV70_9EUKA
MSKIKKTSFFVCSPEEYAKAAMKSIGYGAIESPYPAHKLQMLLTGMLPICALKKLYTYLMFDLRKRSLEKLKRNK